MPAAWAVGTIYTAGDEVSQAGLYYTAARDHTALTGDVADGAPDQANSTAWTAKTTTVIGINQGGEFAAGQFLEIAGEDNNAAGFDVVSVNMNDVTVNGILTADAAIGALVEPWVPGSTRVGDEQPGRIGDTDWGHGLSQYPHYFG